MSTGAGRKQFSIQVDGDIVVDHHIYRGYRDHPTSGGRGTRILRAHGGAGLTAALLQALVENEPDLTVYSPKRQLPDEPAPDSEEFHAYATWAPFAQKKDDRDPAARVWRVSETFGFGSPGAAVEPLATETTPLETPPPDVLVIDEGSLGFRHQPDHWPAALGKKWEGERPWIVLKMSHAVCRGDLWAHLAMEPHCEKLIVIVAADDLRRSGASISKGLSWERSVQELLGDLEFDSDVSQLKKARHVIVNFGDDGAVWVDNRDRARVRRQFIFDPGNPEGTWQEELEGTVLGAGSCLAASVAGALFPLVPVENPDQGKGEEKTAEFKLIGDEDLGAGIARGLDARRALLLSGHGLVSVETPGFPYADVLEALKGRHDFGLRTSLVPDSAVPEYPGDTPDWSIVAGTQTRECKTCHPLYIRARQVAIHGEGALLGIPYGRFGKLYTVDRIELSGYHGVRRLIIDYMGQEHTGKPLSLGVFGPPGAGKSFGIKQIARGLLGENTPILTFNLSQFDRYEMLIGALHQVRDEVLRGEVPVVFWDEFDCEKLRWLRYMLAPMNDGEFLEGQVTHPVGKCIFIFAGGTCDCLQEFSERKNEEDQSEFISCKGPDFVSRLKGCLNVLGPNPREVDGGRDPRDAGFPIRRAIMLRVLAGCFRSEPLSIDPGLLNAMLKITGFRNGARSMESIINLITGGGSRRLLICNLPPREQLELHVSDYDEFIRLVHEGSMFKLRAEALAPHIHAFYLDLAKQEGWTPTYPCPYDELPPEIKEDNIAAARRLPDVLSLIGLLVVEDDGAPGADPDRVEKKIEDNIELLAEAEHDGWMEFKLASGWQLAQNRDDSKKRHPALIPYQDLSPEDQIKDRNSVRHYPKLIERAKFLIRIE